MNTYLEQKKKRYDSVVSSNCFLYNLKGLATVELNITELCSRKCVFCPRHDSNVYANQKLHMSPKTVHAIGQNLNQESFHGEIFIAGFGEPMLHPNLPALIQILRKYLSNDITLITNGDFLTAESANVLKMAGLTRVTISCYDGPEAKNKFEVILKNSGMDFYIRELWYNSEAELEQVVKSNNFNNRTGLVPMAGNSIGGQCFFPFYHLVIDWNGEIILCANDWYRKENNIGNVNTTPLKDIWMGEKLTTIRKDLASGNRCGKACKDCSVNGVLMGSESFELWKR